MRLCGFYCIPPGAPVCAPDALIMVVLRMWVLRVARIEISNVPCALDGSVNAVTLSSFIQRAWRGRLRARIAPSIFILRSRRKKMRRGAS